MIPRKIHCCWFGGPKTRLAETCLASWKKHAPECEVREWGEDDLRAAAKTLGFSTAFFDAAIAAGKWAMASDWARMVALYAEGGVYLDLDVELVAPIDRLPDGEWVSSEMTANGSSWMNPGSGIALEKGSAVARHMLDAYGSLEFDPKREMMPWINDRLAETSVKTLASEVMSPVGIDGKLMLTDRTVGIHHYAMSWAPASLKVARWLSWHGMRWLVDAILSLKRSALKRTSTGRRTFLS